jgi:uncharacterized protein with PQ loop repeat
MGVLQLPRIFIIGTRKETKTMGLLSVLISAVAALLFYITGHRALIILAIIVAFGNFWSWGVMRNKAQAAPNWIKWINLLFTTIAIVLLFTGILMKYY